MTGTSPVMTALGSGLANQALYHGRAQRARPHAAHTER
jgi:hypothetical protein